MKYAIAYSAVTDGYRAGTEIGEALAGSAPEVVLVFCSIHYLQILPDVVSGIQDTVGKAVLCCGGTGDGVYWTGGMANHGLAAMGISSQGAARWEAVMVPDVGADSARAAQQAVTLVREKLGAAPEMAFTMADGCRADGCALVEGFRSVLDIPFFGGLAGDDRKIGHAGVFVGTRVAENSVMLLAASGGVPFQLNAGSGWCPMGDAGRVTEARGATILTIDGMPANTFIRKQIGTEIRSADVGSVPLAEYAAGPDSAFVPRDPRQVDEQTGHVTCFGQVKQGSLVRVCRATADDILGGARTALSNLRRGGFDPVAAIVVSCAGRKWLLPHSGSEEVELFRKEMGDIPMIGFPSFGEIGPFRLPDQTYSVTHFHNSTFVVNLLGR